MIPARLRTATGQLRGRGSSLTPSRIPSLLHGSRTYFQPPATKCQALAHRVHLPNSRAPRPRPFFSSPQYLSLSGERTFHRSSSVSKEHVRILQSKFPTKTFLFLLTLGVGLYYLDIVEIEVSGSWGDRVLALFGEPLVTPLHFNQSVQDVDHWIQYHIPDPHANFKNPEVPGSVIDNFDSLASGWLMSEEEAIEVNMPVTHGCRLASNWPCEDYFALGTSPGPSEKLWNFWAVFDGHAGKHTAQYLQWQLLPQMSRSLSALRSSTSSFTIENCIKQTFLRVDNELMARAKNAGNWFPAANAVAISALTPAFSGSCALMAAFDPASSKLRMACTGDSRAVLGRWDPFEENYTCIPLSADQTGFNQLEIDRINAEHPDEPDIIDPKSGRLLGIAVTRAFGDHRWKWDNDYIKQMQIKFWGSAPRPGSKTPPYMTAEPEVTETEVVRTDAKDKNGKSDFMIMASDGLWDRISSEHAVECVQQWLEAKARGNGKVADDPQRRAPMYPERWQPEPGVEFDAENGTEISWKATPEYFAIEDENAATCLAKNAMGGTRRGLMLGILSTPSPLSRYAYDDTTIMVVFFDKLGNEGETGMPIFKEEKSKWWPW